MFGTVGVITAALLSSAPSSARQLTTQQVRALLVDAIVDFRDGAPDGKGISSTREFFGRNGRYGGEFDNYDAIGTYQITNRQVCVREQFEGGCRSIYIDAQGQYWMTFEKNGHTRRIWLSKIPKRKR